MAGGQALPSGLVTFVFTDIEGSTRVLKRLGDAYPAVLERHRELLRRAWAGFRGVEVSVEGDGSFVAFANARDAAGACAKAQQLLASEPWPAVAPIRVRMGIHSGLAAPHNGDYVALAVHQAARVKSAAHGGQVLLSEEAAAGVRLPRGLSLVELGRYRLRDFDEPVRLFQLVWSGLTQHFPAPRAVPAEGHNLVRPPNLFVGRDEELARVRSSIGPGAVVTIAGPGGAGKTRLAVEVGLQVAPSWPAGVWLVDVSTVEDRSKLADCIGTAVGAPGRGEDRWLEVLEFLGERRLLVILDGIEAYVGPCADLVQQMLQHCPGVGILATSQEPLKLAGEVVLPLGPLPVPGPRTRGPEAQASPAVQLFAARARDANPAFALTETTEGTVADICRQLDGVPLAIEIAAARAAVLHPEAILAGVGDMFRLLRSRGRSLPPRQRTMQATLEWSYGLLDGAEQRALRHLSVFGAGFSLEAAAAAIALGATDGDDAAELVWSLVDKSLVSAHVTAEATRYRCLIPIQQYGRMLLDQAGETGVVAAHMAAWYIERLGPQHAADRRWIGDTGVELDNLHALIPPLAPENPAAAQTLAWLIGRYHDATQAYRLGIGSIERYARELSARTPQRVAMLTMLADLHLRIGDVETARAIVREAQALRDEVGPADWDDAGVERTIGEVALRSGDPQQAAAIAEAALRRGLSARGLGRMWNLLGIAQSMLGDHAGARDAFAHERDAHAAAGHEAFVAGAEGNLAEIALRLGDYSGAARHQLRCLESSLALGQPVMIAYSLMVAARLAGHDGNWSTATRLQASALAIIEETGQRLYNDDLRASDELSKDARASLGAAPFEEHRAAGRAMDIPAAVQLASRVLREAASAGGRA